MTALRIGVSYTSSSGGGSYSFQIDNFGDNSIPRSYVGSYEFSLSTAGSSVLSGAAFSDKYQWAISTKMSREDAEEFDSMYRAWDDDRSQGKAAALGISDETFGAVVNTNAIFVTPPSYVRLSPKTYLVSFGMQEV